MRKGTPLVLLKEMGEESLISFSASSGTLPGSINCDFELPESAAGKHLIFFTQKVAEGKGTEKIKHYEAGIAPTSPFTIPGLEAGVSYNVYASIADSDYEHATKFSESLSSSSTAKA